MHNMYTKIHVHNIYSLQRKQMASRAGSSHLEPSLTKTFSFLVACTLAWHESVAVPVVSSSVLMEPPSHAPDTLRQPVHRSFIPSCPSSIYIYAPRPLPLLAHTFTCCSERSTNSHAPPSSPLSSTAPLFSASLPCF
jgi:hypothetical protein